MPMMLAKLKGILVDYDQRNNLDVDSLAIQALKFFYKQYQHQAHLDTAQEWALLQCFVGQFNEQNYLTVFTYLECITFICAEPAGIEPWRWLQTINTLQLKQLFHLKNFTALKNHSDPRQMMMAIGELQAAKLCDQANLGIVFNHSDTAAITSALCQAAEADILDDSVRQILKNHPKPLALVTVFKILAMENLNTITNRDRFIDVDNVWYSAMVIDFLSQAQLLNQGILDRLFLPEHAWLLSSEARLTIWHQLNEADFSEQVFNNLLMCARAEDPNTAAAEYLSEWDTLETTVEEDALLINDSESTHVASVHKTASESALRLYHRYGATLTRQALSDVTNQAVLWVISRYDDHEKNQAALRGILYLTETKEDYCDPVSHITLNTLMALVWLAIHDEQQRAGSLEDALSLFLEGFYEIQRGNNLSVDGLDNGDPYDERICDAGAFNKLIEKLQVIHSDCVIHFMTEQTASFKLPKVVKEEVQHYLLIRAVADSYQAAVEFTQLITILNRDGLSCIWPEIEPVIRTRLFEEFGSLYKSIDDPKFNAFIKKGKEIDLGDMTQFQRTLQRSKGYQTYCSSVLQAVSFFKNRRIVTEESSVNSSRRNGLSLGA